MSLTFKVTIPVGSLDKLQSMSPFYNAVYGVYERSDESEAVIDVCKAVFNALKDMPYKLVPKREVKDGEECICDDCHDTSNFEDDENDESREGDDESEDYDEINAEECDARSTAESTVLEENDDRETATESLTHTTVDHSNGELESEANDIAGRAIKTTDDEDISVVSDAPDSTSFTMRSYSRDYVPLNDGENGILTIAIDVDATARRVRLSLNEHATWNDLAAELKRMSVLIGDEFAFVNYGSLRHPADQCQLRQSGVGINSVIRVVSMHWPQPLTSEAFPPWPPTYTSAYPIQDHVGHPGSSIPVPDRSGSPLPVPVHPSSSIPVPSPHFYSGPPRMAMVRKQGRRVHRHDVRGAAVTWD